MSYELTPRSLSYKLATIVAYLLQSNFSTARVMPIFPAPVLLTVSSSQQEVEDDG
jgi:hypothetical protein